MTSVRFWQGQPSGELEVLCCLFWHNFSLIGDSMLWGMVFVANWSTFSWECLRKVFCVRNVPPVNPGAFLLTGGQALWLCLRLQFGSCSLSSGERVADAESLNHDFHNVSMACGMWRMKLNLSKTNIMIFSWSCSIHSQSTPLTLNGTYWSSLLSMLYRVWWCCLLGVLLTFEKHLCSVSRAAAQMFGITRKSWLVFYDWLLLLRSFWRFILPVLEYCSAVWCSAADSHLKLLE